MSETGLENFDRTLQKTHLWLNEIGETLGPDRQRHYHAMRAVMFALRDRLPIEEAFHLSSNLPTLVRGVFWESYRPAGKPEKYRSREEFLNKIAEHLDQTPPIDPEDAARAVFGAIQRHVSAGEVEEVKHLVPEEVRTFFPQAEGT